MTLRLVGPAMLLLLAGGVPARADVPESDMVRCATIVADSDRLACYDKLAAGVSREAAEAVKVRQAAAAEAEKARKAAEEKATAERKVKSFGAEQAGLGDDESKLEELDATVVEAYTDKYDKILLHLDNGQMWKQIDGKLTTVRSGDKVVVKRASLGGYRITVVRQKRTVLVKRIK